MPPRLPPPLRGPLVAAIAPPPRSPKTQVGERRLRRALVAPPQENLSKYGFLTATAIERLKNVPAAPPPRTPVATVAKPTYRGNYAGPEGHAAVPYGAPGYKPVDTGAPRHLVAPKAPSYADLLWRKQQQAIGQDVLRQAANPRVHALEAVLGGVTGIPSLVGAVRKQNIKSAAVQAAMFLPFGKAGEVLRIGSELDQAARAAAPLVRGDGRKAFAQTIKRVAPDRESAKVALARADVYVHEQVAHLPTRAERNAAAQDLFDRMRISVPERPIPGFQPTVAAKKAQANLRSVTKPGNVMPPKSVQLPSMHEAGGGFQVVGDITPEEWWARTQHAVGDAKTGLRLANWYAELGPLFKHFFGEDANPILRGFAVSQANASPAGGLTNVLRVRDKLLRGEVIKDNEISTVVKSIEAAYQGQPVTKGMQAKLHDFANALEGKNTRTWTADDIAGGQPTPTDIHALRDLGFIDPTILNTLRRRHGLPVAHLQWDMLQADLKRLNKKAVTESYTAEQKTAEIAAQQKKIANFEAKNDKAAIKAHRASGLKMDSGGVASVRQYNHAVARYRDITDYLNQIQAWGKSDWKPYEVQALGWSAIQRFHGVVPEDALFAVNRNTTSIAFEILNGTTKIGDGLSPAAQYAVTKHVADAIVPRVLEQEGVIPRGDLAYGLGGYEGEVNAAAYMRVLASPEQVDRVVSRLANLFDQYDVWGVRAGVSVSKRKGAGVGKAALEIYGDDFGNPQMVERFWSALRARVAGTPVEQHFKGFSSYTREVVDENGLVTHTPGIRIITDVGPVTKAKSDSWSEQFHDMIVGATEDAQLPGFVDYNSTNVEIRDAVQAQSRTRAASRVGARRGVGDPLAAEAKSVLADAVERYAGSPEKLKQATRELHARGGLQFHDPHGLAHGIPIEPPPAALPPSPGPVLATSAHVEEMLAEVEQHLEAIKDTPGLEKVRAKLRESRTALQSELEGLRNPVQPEKAAEIAAQRLEGAGAVRKAQDATRGPETARRFGNYRATYDRMIAKGHSPTAAYEAASRELRGEYPKLNYKGFADFSPEAVDQMIADIHAHPELKETEAKRAVAGLLAARNEHKVPQPSQLKLLRKVFPGEVVDNVVEATKGNKWGELAVDILNTPRSIQSSFDVSALGRQAIVAGARHPMLAARNVGPMLRAFVDKAYYEREMGELYGSEFYPAAEDHKLDVTDIGRLSPHEEAFASRFVGKIPGIRGSARAYTFLLNKMRMGMWEALYSNALRDVGKGKMLPNWLTGREGEKAISEKEALDSLANYINHATGRGEIRHLKNSIRTLNGIFFSPRLVKSRFNLLLNPRWYARQTPYVRRQALRAMFQTVTMGMAVLGIAKMAGAQVGMDPRSANFGKIRVGNTRFDIWGGFQPLARYAAQLATGTYISSSTGKKMPLGSGFGQSSRLDILVRAARSKESPTASLLTDWLSGSSAIGKQFHWVGSPWMDSQLVSRMSPLLAQDAVDLFLDQDKSTQGILKALGIYGIGMWGIGTQTYSQTPPPSGGGGGFGGGGFGGGGFGSGGFGP